MFCYFAAPSFCNASWPFDVKVLKDIRGDMDTYWPDIEVATHGIFTDSCNKFFLWFGFFYAFPVKGAQKCEKYGILPSPSEAPIPHKVIPR